MKKLSDMVGLPEDLDEATIEKVDTIAAPFGCDEEFGWIRILDADSAEIDTTLDLNQLKCIVAVMEFLNAPQTS